MKTRNILFIVEGENVEVELMNKIIDYYLKQNNNYIIYPYKTNIYDLYFKIKDDPYLETIPYLIEEKTIPDLKYSEVFLVFDLDCHHTDEYGRIIYTRDIIKHMLEFFNDSYTNGEIYINYPMVESYKHIFSYNIDEFLNTQVTIRESNNYKELVGKRTTIIKSTNDLDKNLLGFIMYCNYTKSVDILNNEHYQGHRIPQDLLFQKIYENYLKLDCIPVLNTLLFMPLDYFKKEERAKLISHIKIIQPND